MTDRPRLLDLYCGAGGAAMGYHRAGFDVVGVDNRPMPRYPFEFAQGDALEYCAAHGREYDAIHASPPCQAYSPLWELSNKTAPDLVDKTRDVLIETGKPYVIENVIGSPLRNGVILCGTMFGLRVLRHRHFETLPFSVFPPATCRHIGRASGVRVRGSTPRTLQNFAYLTITGNDYLASEGREAMGIEWMTKKELSQSIPPAYTEYIGRYLLAAVLERAP